MGRFSPTVLPQPVESPWVAVRDSVRRGMDRHQAESDRQRHFELEERRETRADSYLALQQTINQRAQDQRDLENRRYERERAIRDAAAGMVQHDDAADHSRRIHIEGVGDIDPTRSSQYIGEQIERDRRRGEAEGIADRLQGMRPGMSRDEAVLRAEHPDVVDFADKPYQPRTFEEWQKQRAAEHGFRLGEIRAQMQNRSTSNTQLDRMIDDQAARLGQLRLRLPRVVTSRNQAEHDNVMAQIRAGEQRLQQLEREREKQYGYDFQPAPVDAPYRQPQPGETGMRARTPSDRLANEPPSLRASTNLRPLTQAEKDAAARDPGFKAWLQKKGYVF